MNNKDTSFKNVWFLVIYTVFIIDIIIYRNYILQTQIEILSIFSTILMLCVILCLCFSTPKGMWSIATVYIIIFSLFHFGIISVVGIKYFFPDCFDFSLTKWIYTYNFKYSVILVSLGLVSFSAGVHFLKIFVVEKPTKKYHETTVIDEKYTKIGFWFVLLSFLYWFYTVVKNGGLGLFLGSYSQFKDATTGFNLKYTYFFIGLGLFFLVISRPSRLRKAGIGVFVIFSVLALPLGFRGEVLFPVFTSLAIVSMKKVPISPRKFILIGIALLSLITVIKQVRQVGLGKTNVAELSFNPTNSLVEMGGSIRPVVEVVRWAGLGDNYMYGSTYWAPIDRILVYFIPGWTRPPADEDDRLLGNVVQRRAGAIGFSSIAEAYRNFGLIGVSLFMFLIGVLFSRMDLWEGTQHNQIKAGIILLPLMMEIRNTFIFVPFTMALGFTTIYIVNKINDKQNKNEISI